MSTLVYSGVLVIRECWCGIKHAIPENLSRHADEKGIGVYCPLGHQWWVQETEVDRLRKRAALLDQRVACRDEDLRAARAERIVLKGQLTKARNRAAKGLCPCCNRSFVDVARHVATKHPDFTP